MKGTCRPTVWAEQGIAQERKPPSIKRKGKTNHFQTIKYEQNETTLMNVCLDNGAMRGLKFPLIASQTINEGEWTDRNINNHRRNEWNQTSLQT